MKKALFTLDRALTTNLRKFHSGVASRNSEFNRVTNKSTGEWLLTGLWLAFKQGLHHKVPHSMVTDSEKVHFKCFLVNLWATMISPTTAIVCCFNSSREESPESCKSYELPVS